MSEQYAEIFVSVRPELAAYLHRLVMCRHLVDDLVQTTFLRLIEHGGALEPAGMRPWLFRVATNLAIDELRRQARWGRRS